MDASTRPLQDFVVSSTRVRHLITEGRVDEAARAGPSYFLDGIIVHGENAAGSWVPDGHLNTVNELLPATGFTRPSPCVNGVRYHAVTSVGVRPTITARRSDGPGDHRTYLRTCREPVWPGDGLVFVQWLRPEEKFDTLEALSAQIARDCDAGRQVFARAGL